MATVIETSPTLGIFHPLVREWFARRFGEPTDIQTAGWPAIASGSHTLIAAPTGSGKTLAAFLVSIDQLVREADNGPLPDCVHTIYVSPLKALSNDIHRNLEVPVAELAALAPEIDLTPPAIRVAVRTGDTPSHQRLAMIKRPAHILVTTPESLYLLVTSARGRRILGTVKTVIVDEIHALARDKRGSHLSLTLERLERLTERPPTRIGISATQKPLDEIARFLVGTKNVRDDGQPNCRIIDVGHIRQLDLSVEVPSSEIGAVCSNEQWAELHARLVDLIKTHRSTLIFVNTRRLAERLSFNLSEILGKEHVTSHHGSLSKEIRLDAERRLKAGELKAIVATASLELGIDIGYIDLVCQVGSPRAIATLLQRVGRSGHSLGALPKGRLLATTRDELVESLAIVRAVRKGILDAVEIPRAPLDILAQQIVAEVAFEQATEDELFEMARGAWPFHTLLRDDFDAVIASLSGTPPGGVSRGAHLHRDRINRLVRASRGSAIIAATCGGAIPDNADFRVVTAEEGSLVGTINEDFAIESMKGDIFLLGNTSWRILAVRTTDVVVEDAKGAPPTIPFWLGEAPGRTPELSHEVSELRREVADRIDVEHPTATSAAEEWLAKETGVTGSPIVQAVQYIAAQKVALGLVPTDEQIVFERFFDEMGGMQLVIHAPLGSRINRAWGLAMRKRFCRSFDFELQASADDDGVVLSLGPQHSFPIDQLFGMLGPHNDKDILEQAILDAPLFKVRWRWNASRSLMVLRQRGGKRVPPALQRHRSDDLLTALFPASTACLENRPENIELPDHPIVRQTMLDCLYEATDFTRWHALMERVKRGEVEFIARDTREPSPFSHQRLNANPYAFLDDAPLEERRARMVQTRRTLSVADMSDLAALDVGVIDGVREQAWPTPRSVDEFHECLLQWGVMPEVPPRPLPDEAPEWRSVLLQQKRSAVVLIDSQPFLIASENWPVVRAAFGDRAADPGIQLPPDLDVAVDAHVARASMVRGWLDSLGPTTVEAISSITSLAPDQVEHALLRLESEGSAMQGRFDPRVEGIQWCQRRLLARIHRQTLEGARKRVEAVAPDAFLRLLMDYHGLLGEKSGDVLKGKKRLLEVIGQLEGFESPAGAWELDLLPTRIAEYEPAWLDTLTLTGQVSWGRLQPPTKAAPDAKRLAGLNRVVPISLFLRDHLPWLLPEGRIPASDQARGDALTVLESLAKRGALFFNNLVSASGLLPAQVEQALSELAALGLVSADGFSGIRSLVTPKGAAYRSARRRIMSSARGIRQAGGRWCLFPDHDEESAVAADERVEHWARLLLNRYGVVFRDLLARETVAPAWWQLVTAYRRMEARGQVHGGRFVSGVAAEQYALPGIVDRLRSWRDNTSNQCVILSAADPLNLAGIVEQGDRIPAMRGNAVAMMNGQVIAWNISGEIGFASSPPAGDHAEIIRRLRMNGVARQRAGDMGACPPPTSGAAANGHASSSEEPPRL